MTEQTIKMWETWADPREVFMWAFFYRHPDAREELTAACVELEGLEGDALADALARVVIDWRNRWALPHNDWVPIEAIRVAEASLEQQRARWVSPPPPEIPGWDHKALSRTTYENNVKDLLALYCDNIERQAKANREMSPRELRRPDRFFWAVEYVRGKTLEQITKDEKKALTTVYDGVESVMTLIGLTMRSKGPQPKEA